MKMSIFKTSRICQNLNRVWVTFTPFFKFSAYLKIFKQFIFLVTQVVKQTNTFLKTLTSGSKENLPWFESHKDKCYNKEKKKTGLSGEIYKEKIFYQSTRLTGAHWKENRKSNQKTGLFVLQIFIFKWRGKS